MTDGILLPGETLTNVNDGIQLIQNDKGLRYGTDALMLADFIRPYAGANAAEFGGGTGIISLLLAKRGSLAHIDCYEVQPYYAALAARNVSLNGLCEKVTVIDRDIRLIEPIYDVIFSNPPYMKIRAGRRNEDEGKYLARHEVMGDIGDFCRAAGRHLRFGGIFYCVYRPDRMPDLLYEMRLAGIEPKRMMLVFATSAHEPCLLLVEGKKGGHGGCRFMPPMILSKESSGISPDVIKTEDDDHGNRKEPN